MIKNDQKEKEASSRTSTPVSTGKRTVKKKET